MKYTVVYTKRSFLKNRVDIKSIDKEGTEIISGNYQKNVTPGSVIRWRLKYNPQSNRFPIELTKDQLNDLVKDIGFFDKKGNQITTANPKNPADPFFIHDNLTCVFEGGSKVLDDERELDRFFLACFKQDREFYFVDDSGNNLGKSALTKYTVTKAGHETKENSKNVDEALEAADLLRDMSFERQVQVLKAFGVNMTNPDPHVVKNTLYTKISEKKDALIGGKRNIEKFLELAKANSSELNLRDIITDALGKGIIFKKPQNKYHYGEIFLGRSLDIVYEFLSSSENEDIKNEIIYQVKKK